MGLVLIAIASVQFGAALAKGVFEEASPWTLAFLRAAVASVVLLSWSLKVLPLGTAYAIWTGIGAVGAFIVGVMVLGEALTPMRIGGVVLIVSGLVVLKLSSSH